ncbi:hypothetical protein A6R68_16180 [Neotoma lepida]|uniref:Glycosylation-dependent cell adhesion molecule 1 n=1 Tax=Neotoma lepida TaxID=56216 RepID=A0A1A6HGH8_NEOLE|nr:hypothetical protein A6R68_16180 [Neotoma lepida]
MKFFTVLLFVSLATASLAVLPGEYAFFPTFLSPLEAIGLSDEQHHHPYGEVIRSSQSILTSPISKESTSNKDSSKEPSIIREELVSKDNVVIECTKSKSQKAQAGISSGASQLEETTEPTTSAGMS